ncbi:16S rRNA (guanine(966)-N(2))-methyltransferase RsmD [Desulfobulbus rhabdoformis]|uniref:16S rRNA (guanine(966)-N(2))-methyltransferase RsmD n=1 Tax=Desulfobulbus rhabdoformis TaxID=34032 RepID=UPI00196255FB|nr:16S rRNA (guanine(966)-N(2))-methyltransferase RsmD [Desulfobulbus rhabdoformis]
MRITGGSARGRKLTPPKSSQIRPTCDRVREALFNILGPRIAGARVLDCFAGTGALGIEALSRGADFALFVDQSLEAGRLIESNLRSTIQSPQASFERLNLATTPTLRPLTHHLPSGHGFDLIMMDPPYRKRLALRVLELIERDELLAPDGLVVVEEQVQEELPQAVGSLELADHRSYGESGIWLYTFS